MTQYIIGGLLVGLGITLIYLLTGIYGGSSSVFTSMWSYVSSNPFFQTDFYRHARFEKMLFMIATIGGGLIYLLYSGTAFHTQVQWWRLMIGGFLVGVGTRLGRGCTSGHGICGLSAWSFPSLVSVIIFMITAILTAHLIGFAGVLP